MEEHLTVLARILTGKRQTCHDAPAKRSNMSGTMRGVDSQGAWQEGGGCKGQLWVSKWTGQRWQILGRAWNELESEIKGGNNV